MVSVDNDTKSRCGLHFETTYVRRFILDLFFPILRTKIQSEVAHTNLYAMKKQCPTDAHDFN